MGMELIESLMWVAVGFGPTLAALVGISRAGILHIRKYGRIAKVEFGYPSSVKKGEALPIEL